MVVSVNCRKQVRQTFNSAVDYQLISFQRNADIFVFSIINVNFNTRVKLAATTCLQTVPSSWFTSFSNLFS